MGRQKSVPTRSSNSAENWSLLKPLDYIPKKGRSRRNGFIPKRTFHKVVIASNKHQQFYLGELLVGTTNNVLPDKWDTCKMCFATSIVEEEYEEHLLITLDSTTIIIKPLPENDILKEIIVSKIFAISVKVVDENVNFGIYFCQLPLPKFTKRIGLCIQAVLSLLLEAPVNSYGDEDETDFSMSTEITELYTQVKKTREKELILGCDNVQNPRLRPILRPYQGDAVRWMIYREKKSTHVEEELHPLYTVIKLKSGLDIYYDKYSGYVEVTKPVVEAAIKGGILADEMGLGKTVEVLACILEHPKPSEKEETFDIQKSPTIELINQKRKLEECKTASTENTSADKSKKLKVPEDWIKSSSKKSQTFIALQTWYESILQSACKKTEPMRQENVLQCICGSNDEEGKVTCKDCGKHQHGSCLGYKKKFGPYICPQCWMNQPLLECKATLIVSPVSLRTQWCKEICRHIKGDFKVLQYGRSSATPIYPTELAKYDIVITTYNVLQSELRLTENDQALTRRFQRRYSPPGCPLTRVKWWRLCLDEAQTVESPTNMVSAMAKKLNAHHRWAVTGTPISKNISDLHGLIDYLQMEPYNDKYTWEQLLFNPYMRGQTEPMLKFLSEVLWRSSKSEIIDQIDIPKQTIEEHWLLFSAIEQYFYRCEHQSSREDFLNKAKFHNPDTPLQSLDKSSLKTVLDPLLSLRQVCTFPNSSKTRYLATKKPVKSMKDLLAALIMKNTNESEEFLRVVLSSLNGLAGIYLILQHPEQAIEVYRKVLQLYARFTNEEKFAKLAVDKLQIIHTMYNLADILEIFPPQDKTLRDDTLRKDCAELEQKYIEKFITQSMSALQDTLLISGNLEKLRDSFILEPGRWYSDLFEWIYVHSYNKEFYTKVVHYHSRSNVECTIDYRNARSLIYVISNWDDTISTFREKTLELVNGLYTHCPDDEFQILIPEELVEKATDCHLRPSKSKNKKCPVCVANTQLKSYEIKLFSMTKRTENFEDMSLQGSWKPTPEELILKSLLFTGKTKNADSDIIKDGEVHLNIIETLKKEFKEVRKLWTFLHQQICAQDELDMCKIRLQVKKKNDEEKQKKLTPILKNLTYNLANKLETIHVLGEHELEHQRIVLQSEEYRNMTLLEKNLGKRSYLETLHQQQHEDQSLDPCPICKNALEQHWSIVPCGHSYCLECIQLLIDQMGGHHLQCSVCREYHTVADISYIKNSEQNPETETVKIVGNYSTKVEAIVKLILHLKSEEPDVKVLVFSLWTSVLTYLGEAFTQNEISSELVSSGTLEKQIEKFKDGKQNITALLLPINLGGKGLNLVEATHVILTEPLLNLGEELQAIGRVHRIGQTRPTFVHKFFINNTIEESIQKAISRDTQNWEKNKVTIRQLMDLFANQDSPAEESTIQTET